MVTNWDIYCAVTSPEQVETVCSPELEKMNQSEAVDTSGGGERSTSLGSTISSGTREGHWLFHWVCLIILFYLKCTWPGPLVGCRRMLYSLLRPVPFSCFSSATSSLKELEAFGSSVNSESDLQLIMSSEKFQQSLAAVEEAVVGNIFQSKLAAYWQLPVLPGKHSSLSHALNLGRILVCSGEPVNFQTS